MAYNKNDKADGAKFRRGGMRRRKKVCVFCGEKNGTIDYKDVNKLKRYVSETYYRQLCKASESTYRCNQESKTHRSYALHNGINLYFIRVLRMRFRKKLWGLIFLQKSRKFPSVFPVFFHLRLSRISL